MSRIYKHIARTCQQYETYEFIEDSLQLIFHYIHGKVDEWAHDREWARG